MKAQPLRSALRQRSSLGMIYIVGCWCFDYFEFETTKAKVLPLIVDSHRTPKLSLKQRRARDRPIAHHFIRFIPCYRFRKHGALCSVGQEFCPLLVASSGTQISVDSIHKRETNFLCQNQTPSVSI